jgi:hypothetical protein
MQAAAVNMAPASSRRYSPAIPKMPGNHHRGGLLIHRDGVAQQLWSGRMDHAVTLQGHGEVGGEIRQRC